MDLLLSYWHRCQNTNEHSHVLFWYFWFKDVISSNLYVSIDTSSWWWLKCKSVIYHNLGVQKIFYYIFHILIRHVFNTPDKWLKCQKLCCVCDWTTGYTFRQVKWIEIDKMLNAYSAETEPATSRWQLSTAQNTKTSREAIQNLS